MSTGRLVINGKTWGEFESAKRIKGHIVISGYESYGGCHTVRGIKQQKLNENQQIVLDWLKNDMLDNSDFYNTLYSSRKLYVVGEPYRKENIAFMKLGDKELAQVIQAFSQWALEQEEE